MFSTTLKRKHESSVRAFSSIKRNDKFATVKERKAAKKAARQAAAATHAPAAVISSNPFSVSPLCKID